MTLTSQGLQICATQSHVRAIGLFRLSVERRNRACHHNKSGAVGLFGFASLRMCFKNGFTGAVALGPDVLVVGS